MTVPGLEPEPAGSAAEGARWRIRLLGDVSATRGDLTIARWPSRAVASLLATLALEPARAHPREQLIERLWPGVAPDVGRNRLRQALSVLRALIEAPNAPVLIGERSVVRVAPGALDCDVQRFEQYARNGALEAAQDCYRGELMPGFYDDWVQAERSRLAAIHERLATVRPQARPAGAVDPGAAANTRAQAVVELPNYLTRLFGSEAAIAGLCRVLRSERLVTVTGPGGIGKTRLAIEAARVMAGAGGARAGSGPHFERVAFVPLVACSTCTQVLDALLSTLRAQGEAEPLERIVAALRERSVLLVLDNLEQVADEAAPAIAEILARAPTVHFLLTSRRALALDGETLFDAPGLTPPAIDDAPEAAADNPAVALFVDRARAVRADFHLSGRNREALIALAKRLEGLPLAIELAASRVRSFTPAEMLAMLAGPPAERAGLLARRGPRAWLDARHASMQAVVAWSWSLLDAPQRKLLTGLVAFDNGCTAAAAAAVSGAADAALQLSELVAHSLLRVQRGASGASRFALLEPVREFAAARMRPGKARQERGLHRRWVLSWALALPATPPLPEVRDEWGNVAAALASAAGDGDAGRGVSLLLALRHVLEDVGLPDHALDGALRALGDCEDAVLAARGRSVLAPALLHGGRAAQAAEQADLAVAALAPGSPHRAAALQALARVIWRSQRDARRVLPLLDAAEASPTPDADLGQLASVSALRAFVIAAQGRDPQTALALHERALRLWQRAGNLHAVHSGQYNLAVADQNQGRHAQALQRLQPLIESARELHDWRRLSEAHNVAGNALCGLRRWDEAACAFGEALQLAWRHGGAYELSYPLWNLPRPLAHLRQPRAAAQLAAFAARFWTDRFGPLAARDELDLRRVRRLACVQCGPRVAGEDWRAGRLLGIAEAMALARGALA